VPLQASEAVHELAPVEVQVRSELPPPATTPGAAPSVTTGTGAIITVAVAMVLAPPAPEHTTE
jgi:hypothetical protein